MGDRTRTGISLTFENLILPMIARKWLIIIFVIVTFFNEPIMPNLGRLIKKYTLTQKKHHL